MQRAPSGQSARHHSGQQQVGAKTGRRAGAGTDQSRRRRQRWRRPSRQDPAAAITPAKSGTELEQAQKRVQALEASSSAAAQAPRGRKEPRRRRSSPNRSRRRAAGDLASNALAMARLEGEIARTPTSTTSGPRKNLGRGRCRSTALSIEDWDSEGRTRRNAELSRRRQALRKLYGAVGPIKATVLIDTLEINRSSGRIGSRRSGQKIVDDAARSPSRRHPGIPTFVIHAQSTGRSPRLSYSEFRQW